MGDADTFPTITDKVGNADQTMTNMASSNFVTDTPWFLWYNNFIHILTMHFYSVEYWQENWETLFERVENGETIGIENDNGERAVMVPADDELIRLYTEHEEGC